MSTDENEEAESRGLKERIQAFRVDRYFKELQTTTYLKMLELNRLRGNHENLTLADFKRRVYGNALNETLKVTKEKLKNTKNLNC